jgi:hypothetical protein
MEQLNTLEKSPLLTSQASAILKDDWYKITHHGIDPTQHPSISFALIISHNHGGMHHPYLRNSLKTGQPIASQRHASRKGLLSVSAPLASVGQTLRHGIAPLRHTGQ